eukprot:gene8227-10539_t
MDLIYAPRPWFRANGRFVFNKKTTAMLRKIKDQIGDYIWQPPAVAGQPASLFGYPVTEVETMPDPAANSYSVAFGDFSRAYLIVDRAGINVLRDPYLSKPNVLFYTTKRVGGSVQIADALTRMSVVLITSPPAVEPVALSDILSACRQTAGVDDARLLALALAARRRIEEALGLCMIATGVTERRDAWAPVDARGGLTLARGPLLSVDAVATANSLMAFQTVDPGYYV